MNPEDFEICTLSAALIDSGVIKVIAPLLSPEHYSTRPRQTVFEAVLDLHSKNMGVDIANVASELGDKLERIGGVSFLRELEGGLSRLRIHSTRNVKEWAEKVEMSGRLRHVKNLLSAKLEEDPDDIEQFCADILSGVQMASRGRGEAFVQIDKIVSDFDFDYSHTRLSTGFPSADFYLAGGLPYPDLTILGGRPGTGKTQLALQILRNVAEDIVKMGEDAAVGMVSLEMSKNQLLRRMAASGADVASRHFEEEREKIELELEKIRGLPIFIDDTEGLLVSSIVYRTSALASEKNLKLLVIDFAELVGDRDASEELRVSKIYLSARGIAKRTQCSVILIGQLNRQVDYTASKVPSMTHIRYSGMAEAVANLGLLLYNPNQYKRQGIDVRPPKNMPIQPETTYIIIGKNKEGETGSFPMGWRRSCTKFFDLEEVPL